MLYLISWMRNPAAVFPSAGKISGLIWRADLRSPDSQVHTRRNGQSTFWKGLSQVGLTSPPRKAAPSLLIAPESPLIFLDAINWLHISTVLHGLRDLLGHENLSNIPNWTAYT